MICFVVVFFILYLVLFKNDISLLRREEKVN